MTSEFRWAPRRDVYSDQVATFAPPARPDGIQMHTLTYSRGGPQNGSWRSRNYGPSETAAMPTVYASTSLENVPSRTSGRSSAR